MHQERERSIVWRGGNPGPQSEILRRRTLLATKAYGKSRLQEQASRDYLAGSACPRGKVGEDPEIWGGSTREKRGTKAECWARPIYENNTRQQ